MPDGMNDTLMEKRPIIRADCEGVIRPCRWNDCRYHIDSDKASCILDLADDGGMTLEEVGEILGVSREEVRQIEIRALRCMRKRGVRLRVYTED